MSVTPSLCTDTKTLAFFFDGSKHSIEEIKKFSDERFNEFKDSINYTVEIAILVETIDISRRLTKLEKVDRSSALLGDIFDR